MAINFTLTNILSLFAAVYPLFIVFFLVIASLFNMSPLKGLTYLGGLVTSFILWIIIAKIINRPRDAGAAITCSLISLPGLNYKWPSFSVILTFFTFAYLLAPMIEQNHHMNWSVITLLLIFSSINMIYQVLQKCSDIPGILLGCVLGLVFGFGWFSIFWHSGNRNLLFYNELVSNSVTCSRPTNTTFKCSVYRNSELISSVVA